MNKTSKKTFIYFISITAALGGFLFGYDTAVISGTLSFVRNQFQLDAINEGWFVSSALVGCIIGVSMAGVLSDKFGRKRILILSGVLFFVSAVGCAISGSYVALIVYRMIGGVGVGIASMVSPLYISEISPASIRGKMVSLYQFAITIGILIAYFANAYLLSVSTGESEMSGLMEKVFISEVWRGMFGSEAIPALFFMISMLLVPLSPRWLVARKRKDEAFKVLEKLTEDKEEANSVYSSVVTAVENEGKPSFSMLFQPGVRVAVFAGIVLAIFSQFTGINAIIYYGPKIMESAGIQVSDALGSQVIIGLVNVLATIVAIFTIDKLGRKKLMNYGIIGMFVSLLAVGILYLIEGDSLLILTFILTFIASFAIGYGPVLWVLLSEIFPTQIRGRAMSVATMTLWLSTAIVGQVVPWLLENITPSGTFFLFAACCAPVIFALRLLPETKGISLEEIEELLKK